MNKRLNFNNFSNAFITLIRICTGEAWNDLMHVLCMKGTALHNCSENPTYQEYEDAGFEPQGCGVQEQLTWFYFISYTFLLTLVFLNLFIAIILDGYFEASDQTGQALTPTLTAKCLDSWSLYDPDGTGLIPIKDFENLMFALNRPLGWDKSYQKDEKRQKKSQKMIFQQTEPEFIQFNDFLDKIILLYVIRKELEAALNKEDFESEDLSGGSEQKPEKKKFNDSLLQKM